MASTENIGDRHGPARAIVVEDERDQRELVCTLLESAGFRTEAYASSADASPAILAQRPDVVLIDLSLGRESGVDLAWLLRSTPECESLGLIAMTGHVEPEWDTVRPFDAYLRKPIEPELLVGVAARLARSTRVPVAR